MTPDFAKLNLYNSKTLDDVKRYTGLALEVDPQPAIFDYLGPGDLANAHLWKHEHFDYVINEYGFRESKNPSDTNIGAFGCSFTFGSGLPINMLWHQILAKQLNKTCYNFGSPAKSIESVIDIFLIVTNHIRLDSAIFLMPSFTRKQIAKTHPTEPNVINYVNTDLNFDFNSLKAYEIDCDTVYRATPDEELLKNCRNKIYLLDHFAKERGITIYLSSWEKRTYEFIEQMDLEHCVMIPSWESLSIEFMNSDLARDQLHPGSEHHSHWANVIKEYINV